MQYHFVKSENSNYLFGIWSRGNIKIWLIRLINYKSVALFFFFLTPFSTSFNTDVVTIEGQVVLSPLPAAAPTWQGNPVLRPGDCRGRGAVRLAVQFDRLSWGVQLADWRHGPVGGRCKARENTASLQKYCVCKLKSETSSSAERVEVKFEMRLWKNPGRWALFWSNPSTRSGWSDISTFYCWKAKSWFLASCCN